VELFVRGTVDRRRRFVVAFKTIPFVAVILHSFFRRFRIAQSFGGCDPEVRGQPSFVHRGGSGSGTQSSGCIRHCLAALPATAETGYSVFVSSYAPVNRPPARHGLPFCGKCGRQRDENTTGPSRPHSEARRGQVIHRQVIHQEDG
jgi:hypothetical protein